MPASSDVKRTLTEVIARQPAIVFAVLYGSAVELETFRDLDVALYVDRAKVPAADDLDYAFAVADALEDAVAFPVDVRVINDAPLPFRYNVTKGEALYVRDEIAFADFKERTWDMYLDFQHIVLAYFREAQ